MKRWQGEASGESSGRGGGVKSRPGLLIEVGQMPPVAWPLRFPRYERTQRLVLWPVKGMAVPGRQPPAALGGRDWENWAARAENAGGDL